MTRNSSSSAPRRFESTWWSAELPAGWRHITEGACTTFYADPPAGVLQISAVKKDSGFVTDDDLLDFANDRLAVLKVALQPKYVVLGENIGLFINYAKENAHWREWWLRSNDLIIYVTYNVDTEIDDTVRKSEEDAINHILRSLRPTNLRVAGDSNESL